MPDTVVLPPQAARTIEGLRDTGYEPTDALEDIVDNSIAAGATEVVIGVWMTPAGEPIVTRFRQRSWNGRGPDLINAMTYGSAARPNPASLGEVRTRSEDGIDRDVSQSHGGYTGRPRGAHHMRQHGTLISFRSITNGCFSGRTPHLSNSNYSMKLPVAAPGHL